MELWLKENESNKLRFPVLPPELEVIKESSLNTININDLGEVAVFSGNKLSKISISSFFPNQNYSFVAYTGFPKPYDCVKKIETWRANGKPIRFIVTSSDINTAMLIDKFTYKEKDGTGDVYYTLDLLEYKEIKVTKVPNTEKPAPIAPPPPPRPEPPPPPKQRTHTVVRGDSMWAIAQKYYGNGSRYPEIYNANKKIIDEKNAKYKTSKYTIYPGQVFVIP